MTDQRPLLLLIGTGLRDFREYLLTSIGQRYRVHVLLGSEPGWEKPYITGWTQLANPLETIDAAEMIAAAKRLAESEPVAGVLAWDEARVLQGAKVAAELGLPGGDPDAVLRCRDKLQTRQALAAAGVPQPGWELVGDPAAARAAADRFGYPVVLKPRAMAASLGVVRADTPEQLADRFGFARDMAVPGSWRYPSVLVEELLADPEVSLDSAVYRGEVLPMFLARKDVGYPPYFEEIGHVVDAADPLLTDPQVRRVVQEAHTALGFTDGMTHTELKLTPDGPKLIEVNARLGGDLIPYLGQRATGVDPGLAAAAVACGYRPELVADRRRAGAIRFFYVEQDDTTIGQIGIDQATLRPGTRLRAIAEPGAMVSPPPKGTAFGRVAYAVAEADTADECHAAVVAAERALTVVPAAAGTAGTARPLSTLAPPELPEHEPPATSPAAGPGSGADPEELSHA